MQPISSAEEATHVLERISTSGYKPLVHAAESALTCLRPRVLFDDDDKVDEEVTASTVPTDFEETVQRSCEVVAALNFLARSSSSRNVRLKLLRIRCYAVSWMKQIFEVSPEMRRRGSDIIQAMGIPDFPWDDIRPGSRGLALLYNFSPFQDTGATVASKRIRNFGCSVDVIACSFLHRKKQDTTVESIASPYVNRRYFLPLAPSWASWEPYKAYATKASELGKKFMESNKGYEFLYTRAMWAPSLYAGAKFKQDNNQVKWIAEFSDPLSLDVEGLPRGGTIPVDEFTEPLVNWFESRYGQIPEDSMTIFKLAELLVYGFADEIIFTNSHQKQTMLEHIPSRVLRERVEKHCIVENHPTLPRGYYEISDSKYDVDDSVLNLAYFGEFYSSRSITEVTSAMRSLPKCLAQRVNLHVFTNYIPAGDGNRRPRQFSKIQYEALVKRAHDGVGAQGIEDKVHLNASLPYLEFLSTTEQMDYLIVNDARSGEHHAVNPYLPSKWSDYAGSSAKTWAFVEDGSILSSKPASVKTPVGDSWAARRDLWDMIVAKFPDLEREVFDS